MAWPREWAGKFEYRRRCGGRARRPRHLKRCAGSADGFSEGSMRALRYLIPVVVVIAVLAFCPAVEAQTAPADLMKYVHPEARMVIGVDWAKARVSATGRMLERQFAVQGAQLKKSGPGFEMFDAVEKIVISGKDAPKVGADTAGFVVAIEGRIDRTKMKKALPAGTATERFKGVDLLVPPKGRSQEMLMALVGDRVALMGDRASIGAALEGQGAVDGQLMARAAEMAARCEIWMVGTGLSEGAGGEEAGPMKTLKDIESMDLGISLQKGLGVKLNLLAKTEDAARGFATLAQLVTSMAAQDKSMTPEMAAVVKSLKVTTEGTAVRMTVDVPLAQLEKGVMQVKSAGQEVGKRTLESFLGVKPSGQSIAGLRPAVTGEPRVAPVPARVEPPQKRTIKITGGEDGVKEIQYTTGGK